MTGSLQIKNNKFYMVLNTYENGKRKNKWICTDLPVKGNKTKAQKMLRDTLRDYEQEEERRAREEIARATMPFVDAIKLWYKVKTEDFEHPIDEVTKQGYETLMTNHIFPYFEKKGYKLCELMKDKLQACERHEAHFYTKSQIDELLGKIKDEPLYPLIRMTALYGLRRSEALGLCWDCVNFENETITIRRSFPMTPDIKELLLKLKAQQEADKAFFGDTYTESDYVFRWSDGRPFSPDYVSDKFSKLLKANNMPHIRFHELRHSDIKTTANIYGHLDAKRKLGMAEALAG